MAGIIHCGRNAIEYIEYKQSIFTKTNLTDKITTYYNNNFEKKLNTYFIAININGLLVLLNAICRKH
jgi:hypothetical protein